SLVLREKKGSLDEIASSLNETSRIYDILGRYDKAIQLRVRGLELAEKTGSAENMVYFCSVLGEDYIKRLHNPNKGIEYLLKAYEIGKTQKNNKEAMFGVTKSIANTYNILGDFKKANEFFIQSLVLNDSLNFSLARNNYKLSVLKHDLEKEIEKQKLQLKDTEILKVKAIAEKQTIVRNVLLTGFGIVLILVVIVYRQNRQKQKVNIELEKRNKDIEEAYKSLAISESNFKQITETINDVFYLYNIIEKKYEYVSPNCQEILGIDEHYLYSGKSFRLVVYKDDQQLMAEANLKVDSGIAYNIEYRIEINNQIRWIAEKSSPIFDTNGVLILNSGICSDITQRKEDEVLLRKKNNDITNSILYARTIQNAILVPKDEIAKKLHDFFIYSKPKDIVSGDFHFFKETKKGLVIAAADCTGHGVPAGFMSMIGNAYLSEIISGNEEKNPAQILDQLREMIIRSLHQNNLESESKDGMDIALLNFDFKSGSVDYAGAFNSLYLIRNNEIEEIKADAFPIGINDEGKMTAFNNNKLKIEKGDLLYIFSDGFTDQFGGKEGRRFMKKQFKELLLSIRDKKMEEQELILDETFNTWKGDLNQVDDVLIIGIKI
ncbi:MAG: SpoIIE family protein phosphatase, partial [Bacteroidia bacterium]